MRNFIALLLGLTSAVMGILIHRADDDGPLQPLQIGLNELSWIPALLGGLAVLLGFSGSKRSWLTIVLGAVGAGASIWPFMEHRAAADDMASAMRAGLGKDYQTKIPAVMRSRLAPDMWSLENALGDRERTAQARIWRDVVFASPDGVPLKLDIYQPLVKSAVGDKYPAVIVIQGGGWRVDNKGGWFEPHNRYLASQGYVVFDIQHRLSQSAKWPAQLQDVESAIRWVKTCTDEYDVDVDHIALMGRSSGAHIALMAGLTAQNKDTKVQTIVAIYAPTDLQLPNLSPDSSIIQLMGGRLQDMPQAYAEASPIEHVQDDLPPILIVEGMMDSVVPYHHGDKLVNRLSFTNTPFVLLRVPWSRHGFDAVLSGLGAQLVQYHVDRFLAWSLYGENHA